MMIGHIIFLLLLSNLFIKSLCLLQEAPDGSVCFNNCNGHGDCMDYSCTCWAGFIGDDCGTTFVDDVNDIVPILTAGHFNITRKNFTDVVSKNKLLLVGFSSYTCHKCIQIEPAYRNISASLKELKIPFGRANVDQMKSIATEVGAVDLPALVLFYKMRPILYKGSHNAEAVLTYVQKQLDKPAKTLKTVSDVTSFLGSRRSENYGISTSMVVGFFSEHQDIEEDDYEEFMEAAKELQLNEAVYFGVVTNKATSTWFKKNKTIDRTPSLILAGEEDMYHHINLDELYGDNAGIPAWIQKYSIPLVGKMTPQNFGLYEKQGLPILMMFLDLTDSDHVSIDRTKRSFVGGKSGGILNEILLEEFREAAKEHVHRVLFVYLDGTMYEDQMKSLGLYGGKERLPSLAFNTRDRSQVPFPEELPINRDTILQFIANFLSGKLKSIEDTKELAKKALMSALPINPKNKATRKELKKEPEVKVGVSELYGDGVRGDKAIVTVDLTNFDDVVMNEDKDVVLLLSASNCESCAHFAVYFKRMAERFEALAIPTLTIARMDVTHDAPPAELNLMVGKLPILVMIPATNKYPPWIFYSGISKVQQMMMWVHQQASIPFELEHLPHLTDSQKEAYKEQVRQREVELDKKRSEEKRAMAEEEREKAEILRRKRKKQQQASQQHSTDGVGDNDDDGGGGVGDKDLHSLKNSGDNSASVIEETAAAAAATNETKKSLLNSDLLMNHDEF